MRKPDTATLLEAAGLLMVAIGAGVAYLAAGFIIAGIGLVAFGIATERGDR